MVYFISICIPAYKRPENIERLLHSIAIQTYTSFEIIITDDSPDDSVQTILKIFKNLPINYFKNPSSLGTPANWNFAISKAKGEWIKIMHDDDWFSEKDSLKIFADKANEGKPFIFSSYKNIFDDGKIQQPTFYLSWRNRILANPVILLATNVIGPPSVTLIHNSVKEQYDMFMKWRVDIDFYIRVLNNKPGYSFIDKPLVSVGISASQVTNDCINVPEIELPEGLLLLRKYGVSQLQNVLVYDAWWRIIRNLKIKDEKQLHEYTPHCKWPIAIINLVKHQSLLPSKLLNIGMFSKMFMLISYLSNRKFLKE